MKRHTWLFGFLLFSVMLSKVQAQCYSTGPTKGSVFGNDASYGSLAFTNPSNIQSSDNTYATATATAALFSVPTNYLKVIGFTFPISPPTSSLCGIEVR